MSAPDLPPSGSSGAVPVRAGSGAVVPVGTWAPGATAGPGRARGAAPATPGRASVVRASATSFGIVGKTVITVVVLAVGALVAFGNLFGVPVYLVFLVWVLRDLWTRERRAVAPRRPAAQARTAARPVHDDSHWATPSAYDRTVTPPAP